MKPGVIPALGLGSLSQRLWSTTDSDLATRCLDLASTLILPDATVQFTELVPANTTLTFPDNHPSCNRPSQFIPVDICRVVTIATTSTITTAHPESDPSVSHGSISIEAWLPLTWNGRFLATGNGGLNGCIQYEDVAHGISRGFATVGSNNGHNGTSGEPFYRNPAAVEDYVHRALHTSAVLGKLITAAFYRQSHSRAYYIGCSGGGRQGFREAQQYPEDFDGIVAGAPAVAFADLTSWRGSFFVRGGDPQSEGFLTKELWKLVTDDVLAQCDGLDGYVDGILEDPDLCQYQLSDTLLCGEQGNTGEKEDVTRLCLTAAQAATVQSVFSDFYHPNGRLIYPRLQPGTDPSVLMNGRPFQYSVDWFRYVVHQDPTWDPSTLGPDDYTASTLLDPFGVQTWQGELSRARDRGVKILHYHGLRDPLISSDNSRRYYNHVVASMGGLSNADLDKFYRYFRISGMGHCSGGPGASMIGNRLDAVAGLEPERNVLSAIVRWVEDGVAPEYIEGTGYHADGGVFTRRHCRYPLSNRYTGQGDQNESGSWECVLST